MATQSRRTSVPDPPNVASPNAEIPPVFTVTSAGALGLTRKQTRGAAFRTPSRGVRVRRDAQSDPEAVVAAAVAGCRDDAVLCDLAAARNWGLPLPPWIGLEAGPTAVAVPAGNARPKRRGVRGRRLELPVFHVTERDGLRVTTAARTWLDCAPFLPFDHLVAMGDAILHRRLSTEGEMQHLSQWGFRRRGIVGVRRALTVLDSRAESPGESLARVMLMADGIPRPLCNLDVFEGGRWLARVDMAWPDAMVIVEYDGAGHLVERQRRRDAERLNALQAAGWRVIVLTADDLRRPGQTCRLVRRALEAGRARAGR